MRARSGLGCVMPGRLVAVAGAGLLASGCVWFGDEEYERPPRGVAACPFAIVEASAWVNRMPGPPRSEPRPLVVSAELSDPQARAVLETATAASGTTLVLHLVASDAAPISGQVAWRGPLTDPMYERVEIRCDGAPLRVIDEIERVY